MWRSAALQPQLHALSRGQRPARPRVRARASSDAELFPSDAVLCADGRVAAVVRLARDGRSAELLPLVLEPATGLWVAGAHGGDACRGAPPKPFTARLAALVRLDAVYAQRGVADRVSNPHGEHTEETWDVVLDKRKKAPVHQSTGT